MKKTLSAIFAAGIAAASLSVFPVTAADALLQTDFESGLDGWTERGTATVEVTSAKFCTGKQAAAVTNRSESWSGIKHSLDATVFKPGETYSFSAMVTQDASLTAVHFKLMLEYSTGGGGMTFGGGSTYAPIAEKDVAAGMWAELSADYMIPADATNVSLYVETQDSKIDFWVDDVFVGAEGSHAGPGVPPAPTLGDADSNGTVNKQDAVGLLDYLLTKSDANCNGQTADMDTNNVLNARDLSILKAQLMNPPAVVTTAPPVETQPPVQTTVNNPSPGGKTDAKEYMDKAEKALTLNVPDNVKQGPQPLVQNITYNSKKAGHNKNAKVWVPQGYSKDKKYCVLYMNHGIFGDESSMVSGFSVCEMAENLIKSGEAEPFIIVFPQMYTDPASNGGPNMMSGITMDVMDHYDDYVYDLTESLMPYIEQNYSVKTGRENTAIAGFSMGGRESLYCTLMHPELFGYCCASSPAPGIVPASDGFLSNHLGSKKLNSQERMTKADLKFSDSDLPYLLMIGGGTNDGVVGTFPKEYHEAFSANGTRNIWLEVPNGGHDNSVGIPLFYTFFRYAFKG
ncbi:MAG: carbohydrate binding domain-containing protein [Oscillospiraceae bacterium]|nr:carbohydrate binding domain-containing protein [Oscillospiraceae bacterium]